MERVVAALCGMVGVVSCATTGAPPAGSGGAGTGGSASIGSGGGVGVSSSSGGDAGVPFAEAGAFVDAGACAPFTETFTPACVTCLASSCCSQALTCFASSDCFGFVSCQQNCPTGAVDAGNGCLGACDQSYPSAEPAFGMMSACLHTSCSKVCPY